MMRVGPESILAAMNGRSWRAPTALRLYGAVALAAVVEAVLVLRLWSADLHVPFNIRGDSVFFEMMVKSVVDHGWYLTNPELGAPGVLALHDFPQADAIHLLAIKVMSLLFSSDWALLFNLYFLLGFPLIAVSALAVLRHFRVAPVPAAVASLLYAFLPSRVAIGESHFFLSAFFQVPLAILVALWVAGEEPPLLAPGSRRWWPRLAPRSRRSIAAIAIALLVSGTGVYYAFFAGVLIVAAGVWTAIARRSPRHALAGVAVCAVIVVGLAVQSVPTLVYRHRMGPNAEAAARPTGQAETYGLKIAPLLLPVNGHRIAALANLKDRYERATGTTPEVSATSLGVVGAVGFLILLGWFFRRAARDDAQAGDDRRPLWAALARLNLAALLLAATGGFGVLFALMVSPLIRTYARMHVYVAFFALFGVALLLDRLWRARPRAGLLASGAVLFVGLADQTTPAMVPPYARRAREFHADASFVRDLEARLPAGAQIFELPYLRFPEGGGLPGTPMMDYDPLRPYLHSRALRWSYPTMVGRSGDDWTREVADQPIPDVVRALVEAGFDGVVVDRGGYPDRGAAIIGGLTAALGAAPSVTAPDYRLVFFDLRGERERAEAGLTPEARVLRRQQALDRPLLRWHEFFPPESGPDGSFRWCAGDCWIEIINPAAHPAPVDLSVSFASVQPASLRVTSSVWTETIAIAPVGTPIARTLRVPPGRNWIRLQSDGVPAFALKDPRRLVFRAYDAHLRPVD
jgi:phosphoglycerol transferase